MSGLFTPDIRATGVSRGSAPNPVYTLLHNHIMWMGVAIVRLDHPPSWRQAPFVDSPHKRISNTNQNLFDQFAA